jgi:hypothetical protein
MSPLGGTVEASVETLVRGVRNAAEDGAGAAVELVAAGALVAARLEVLLLVLEPPHPASARVAIGTVKIDFLLTDLSSLFDELKASKLANTMKALRPTDCHDSKSPRSFPADTRQLRS